MTTTAIYVISTLDEFKKNTFKIGKHTGCQLKLLSRYKPYLVDPIIFYYRPVINCNIIKNKIKEKLKYYRIKDDNGKLTEWVILGLPHIVLFINEAINSLQPQNYEPDDEPNLEYDEPDDGPNLEYDEPNSENDEPNSEDNENDIYKQYLDLRTEKASTHIHTITLYADFKDWFIKNNQNSIIPSNRVFVANLRNYIIIENVKINGKPSTGTKYLKIRNL